MSRKRVSKTPVVPKKEEKCTQVFSQMNNLDDIQEFKNIFKEIHLVSWKRINNRYKQHEELSKGKPHPMPNPERYLENLYKSFVQRYKEIKANELKV